VPKRMREPFPTAEALVTAAVFDLAGVMLELLAAQPQNQYVVGRNAVSAWAAEYGQGEQKDVIRALSEAWAWLESNGFIADELSAGIGIPGKFVTRAGRNVRSRADFLAYAKASLLPREILRTDLAEVVLPLFLGGHFDAAVGTAFGQLELFVRRACSYPDSLAGVPLMRRAFHPNDGPLTDREALPAEREAVMHLFCGAVDYHENAFRRRVVGLSRAAAAASLILFANELLAQADAHARSRKPAASHSVSAASERAETP
jgi:hypothetical protein